jgi:alpha-1,6-mannosyltransferase
MDITKWFGETSGGVRTYLLQKQAYVEQRAHLRHVLVIPGATDTVSDSSGTRTYRLRGPRIPTQAPYRFLLATRSLPRIVQHERPDLIEVGSPFIVPWLARAAARRIDVPLVNFYHSNFPRMLAPPSLNTRFARYAARRTATAAAWWYVRKLDPIFHTTIVASDFSARELASVGVDRTVRVPLGVDLAHFHPRRRAYAAETRRALQLPDAPIALFVGRFAGDKSLDVVIDAWTTVHRATGATLVLAGDGPLRMALQQRAFGKQVRFLPYQHDREQLADLFAAANLYVAASTVETFGLSALEALASGTPVLSASRGGVAEHVERSLAGATFPGDDSNALAEVAIPLLQSDLTLLGHRGRAYAEREHAWEVVFDRIFDVYADIVRSA